MAFECSPHDWRCRCDRRAECAALPLLALPARGPLALWTRDEASAFLRSLGSPGAEQSCPASCRVPSLFSARAIATFSRHGLNGSDLLAFLHLRLRRLPAPLPGMLEAIAIKDRPLFATRLATALRQAPLGRPQLIWLRGAEPSSLIRSEPPPLALLTSLLRRGWSARIFAPSLSQADARSKLRQLFPSAVTLVEGLPCPSGASSLPLYAPSPSGCSTPSLSMSIEGVASSPGCATRAWCERCFPLSSNSEARPVGAIAIEASRSEVALLLHRVLSSGLFRGSHAPRLLLSTGKGELSPAALSLLEVWKFERVAADWRTPVARRGWEEWATFVTSGAPVTDTGEASRLFGHVCCE